MLDLIGMSSPLSTWMHYEDLRRWSDKGKKVYSRMQIPALAMSCALSNTCELSHKISRSWKPYVYMCMYSWGLLSDANLSAICCYPSDCLCALLNCVCLTAFGLLHVIIGLHLLQIVLMTLLESLMAHFSCSRELLFCLYHFLNTKLTSSL